MTKAELERTVEALKRRGFDAQYCATGEDAKAIVMKAAAEAAVVGMGGSETMKEIGVTGALAAAGREIVRNANCDLFLLSANAVTADGRLVNIDGRGNRVAASISGPGRVMFVVGRNKVVAGGLDAAVARIKRDACPPNCRRLGKKTPCAATGVCADCDSPDRICKVLVVMERRPTQTPTTVLVVDADLGY